MDKKINILQWKEIIFLLFIFICIIVTFITYWSAISVKKKSIKGYSDYTEVFMERDDTLKAWIDISYINEEEISIVGWVFMPEIPAEKWICQVALEDAEKGVIYLLPTDKTGRADVCKAYELGEEYLECGFCGTAQKGIKSLQENKYEIVILYENADSKVYCHTNKFVSADEKD